MKIGKRPLNIKILNEPSLSFQSNFEPRVTKIMQNKKMDTTHQKKSPPKKKNLDLSFTKSDFFYEHN